jgi:hypothetical protein
VTDIISKTDDLRPLGHKQKFDAPSARPHHPHRAKDLRAELGGNRAHEFAEAVSIESDARAETWLQWARQQNLLVLIVLVGVPVLLHAIFSTGN